MNQGQPKNRCILFLQGPLSPFYSDIAAELQALGHKTLRVNFCGNDVFDWKHPGAINFRGSPGDWQGFLKELITKEGVTDIVLHGDRRFYHLVARRIGRSLAVSIVATELGYLRPDWMTVERQACSALSHFPIVPSQIREIAAHCEPPENGVKFPGAYWRLVAQELQFTFFNSLFRPWFPHYQNHRQESRFEVYLGWLCARVTTASRTRRSQKTIADLQATRKPYYLVALQLNGDFQIRDHSPFRNVGEAIRFILRSFSQHAGRESLLVLKSHPLEWRHKSLERVIAAATSEFGLEDRIFRIDTGSLSELAAGACGFVTVNSSAGMEALSVGCPTCSIMPTIYDVEGLTFQGSLDDFWREGNTPDAALLHDLYRALAGTIQVRGTLYNPAGRKAAAMAIAKKIANDTLNSNGAFVEEPPRLAKAARMGVTY